MFPRSTNSVMYLWDRRGKSSRGYAWNIPPHLLPVLPIPPDSRHGDDHEVQPVPGVTQECEVIDAEASRQDLDERLEGVDASEGISEMALVTQETLAQVQGFVHPSRS